MRLTCPNCGAQYEVPTDAIPPGGRDVQCSACGHGWREAGAAAPPPEPLPPEPPRPEPWDEVPRAKDDDEEADDLADVEVAPMPQPAPAVPPRRPASPMAIEILRAEAQREARTRAGGSVPAAAPLANLPADRSAEQPRIALTDRPPSPAEPVQGSIEQALRRRPSEDAAPPAAPPPTPTAPTPRPVRRPGREFDPDAMNATLRPTSERASQRLPPLGAPRRRSSGFGSGLATSLVVLALLAALYLFRPQIVAALPASAAVLDPYAEVVDRGRDWLDAQVARFLTAGLPPEAQPAE